MRPESLFWHRVASCFSSPISESAAQTDKKRDQRTGTEDSANQVSGSCPHSPDSIVGKTLDGGSHGRSLGESVVFVGKRFKVAFERKANK